MVNKLILVLTVALYMLGAASVALAGWPSSGKNATTLVICNQTTLDFAFSCSLIMQPFV